MDLVYTHKPALILFSYQVLSQHTVRECIRINFLYIFCQNDTDTHICVLMQDMSPNKQQDNIQPVYHETLSVKGDS